ncbi:MAG: metallophosphoesterase family protein [Planctomycetota bacterium]
MRRAIVSDIHSNIEALSAVLTATSSSRRSTRSCLGDVIGYGPDPRPCLNIALEFKFTVRGNHEDGLLYHPEDFNERAKVAIEWTRGQLNAKEYAREENYRLWGFLSEMTEVQRLDGALLVHGSPRNPVKEYVLPRDAQDDKKIGEIFALIDGHVCFIGHSHVPGVYRQNRTFLAPARFPSGCPLRSEKLLVNVGSVGQPRDGDNRASYVIWDDDRVFFHRIPYDFEATMRKIHATSVLHPYLAQRLKEGK